MTEISVQYFASLRDERGAASETLSTGATSAAQLYDDLAARFLFSLDRDRVRLAVNDEFAPWETALRQGDRLVFIPPVAGG